MTTIYIVVEYPEDDCTANLPDKIVQVACTKYKEAETAMKALIAKFKEEFEKEGDDEDKDEVCYQDGQWSLYGNAWRIEETLLT